MTHQRTNARHAARTMAWLLAALLLLLGNGGCRAHTAAGCAGGTAVGMLIAAVSVAAADSNVDVGSAVLGGGILGVAAGCTGAGITDVMLSKGQRAQPTGAELPPPPPLYPASKPVASGPRAPDGMILETVELDGLRVLWVAHPKRYPTQVGIRFERYARVPTLVDCTTLELLVDGRSLRFALTGEATPKGMLVLERAKSTIALEDARIVRDGRAVELELCGLRRRFNGRAADKLASFVDRFDALAPAQSVATAPVAAPEPVLAPPAAASPAPASPAPAGSGSAASAPSLAPAVPPAAPAAPPVSPQPITPQPSTPQPSTPAAGTAVGASTPAAAPQPGPAKSR